MVQVSWNSQNIVNAVHSTEEIMNGAQWAGGILNNRYSWVLHPTAGDWRPGLGSPGHKKQGKASVQTQRVYKHTQIQQAANYTVRCVLGILLVTAIINLDQWEATIGWSLLPKYRRCALKSSMWVNNCKQERQKCRRGNKMCTFASAGFLRNVLQCSILPHNSKRNSTVVHRAMLLRYCINMSQ